MLRCAAILALAGAVAGCQMGYSLKFGKAVTRSSEPATLRHPDGTSEEVLVSNASNTFDVRVGGGYVLGPHVEFGGAFGQRLRTSSTTTGREVADQSQVTAGIGLSLYTPPAPVVAALHASTGTSLGTSSQDPLVDGYRRIGLEVSAGTRFRVFFEAGVLWQTLAVDHPLGASDPFMVEDRSSGSFSARGAYLSFGLGGWEAVSRKKRRW